VQPIFMLGALQGECPGNSPAGFPGESPGDVRKFPGKMS